MLPNRMTNIAYRERVGGTGISQQKNGEIRYEKTGGKKLKGTKGRVLSNFWLKTVSKSTRRGNRLHFRKWHSSNQKPKNIGEG